MAGITIFYAVVKVHAGNRPPRVPSVFHPLLSHRDALIIYLNNQRVNTFFANFSTFFITFFYPAIKARAAAI